MKLTKIYCPVLADVWESSPSLRMYTGDYYRGNGIFVCEIIPYGDSEKSTLELALIDYFFNVEDERYYAETQRIWEACKKEYGKEDLRWRTLKTVEL